MAEVSKKSLKKKQMEEIPEEQWALPSDEMVLSFGPQHPATHGTLRIVLELDGEIIKKATPHIGYLHSGFEKLGEHKNYNQWIPLSDRMNYLSAINNNIGFAQAVEKLIGVDIPERAKYLRVIMAELSRISDHMVWLGTHALDIGAFTAFLYTFEIREELYNIFEHASGARLTNSYTRIGGLMRDVPDDFEDQIKRFIKTFHRLFDETDRLLTKNRIWVDRTTGIGYLSKEDAISYGVTGPVLRGSGVQYDVRKNFPYLVYDQFDFDVPYATEGDVYARYLVRMEECRQSIRIIEQAMKKLPGGPVRIENHKLILPDKTEVYSTIESLIHHFKITMRGHGFDIPEGEIYDATEAPNGELGFYIVSDGSNTAYRLRVRPPSFVNYSCFGEIVQGNMVSDVVAVLGSLNIIAGELDR
ncbi:MAG: NADH dehydrogenase (quinone) subunit D [Calditrichia bacterium]